MARQVKEKRGFKARLRSWLIGPVSNTDTALRFTAVFAAIKLLSENIAGLPKAVLVRSEDGGYVPAVKHPAYNLLYVRPNAYMDVFTFWFTIIAWLLGKGNALAVISYVKGKPSALHPVHPDWVKVAFVNGEKSYIVKSLEVQNSLRSSSPQMNKPVKVEDFAARHFTGKDTIKMDEHAVMPPTEVLK